MVVPEIEERDRLLTVPGCKTRFTVRVKPISTVMVTVNAEKPGRDAVSSYRPGESSRAA